jgi:hypothetical protein
MITVVFRTRDPGTALCLFPLSFQASRQFKGSTFNDQTLFPIVRITSCSEACAGWMFSSPLMIAKNTSICYLNRLQNTRSISQQGV